MRTVAILALLVLSGCATAEDRAIAYANQCDNYGFRRGSPEFSNCVMRLDVEQQRRNAAALLAIPGPPPVRTCTGGRYTNTVTCF